jgi:hypothetical protein
VLSLYRSTSGNFDTFILKLEEILNILFQNQVNWVICGGFNVNFMTNNTRKYKITSLSRMYHLHYIVHFPTFIDNYLASIDNIFLHKSRNKNHTIEPYHNGLCNHDALMLTLYNSS